MAKTRAPLLSFGGSGQIGKTMVMSSWRGIKYAREYVIPSNPQTESQQFVRTTFALLREMWKLAPSELLATWNSFAQGRPFTGMNKLVGENIRVLNGEMDMSNFIGSPGSKGGLPPVDMALSVAGGAGEIAVDFTAPAAPPGWTLTKSVAVAFPQQAPNGIFQTPLVQQFAVAGPWDLEFTGLEAGTYVVSGWLVWTKPNNELAYSVSLTDTAVVT